MSKVWDALIGLKDEYIETFNKIAEEYQEPGLAKFNYDGGGWVNRVWRCDDFRRAHVDVVDARESHKLWMMHVCIFPHLMNDGPIYGFDVIAGPNKMTGAFHDYSPTIDMESPMVEWFTQQTSAMNWKRERELPDWAKQIFSEGMMAAGFVSEQEEIEQVVNFAKKSLDYYLQNINSTAGNCPYEFGAAAQNRYAYYQKQNPHTPRVMKSLGLNEADVDAFVGECLFPEV